MAGQGPEKVSWWLWKPQLLPLIPLPRGFWGSWWGSGVWPRRSSSWGSEPITLSSASAPGTAVPWHWSRPGRSRLLCGRPPSPCSRKLGGCARPRNLHTPATCGERCHQLPVWDTGPRERSECLGCSLSPGLPPHPSLTLTRVPPASPTPHSMRGHASQPQNLPRFQSWGAGPGGALACREGN